ncbi:hypothetical protein E2C01_033108 [Portunus trituberculatus]|uniref:Uncharacterized protein n=1 Tax=Portunus trituberculatus TaxID=210409 RepID=A0A5B7F250_PORTR|nr:hypothetical protein [Portunus trituberculatus]
MKLPTRQPVCVATATIINILQKLHKTKVVAHSRPPNHTGYHSHLNTTSGTRQHTAPLRVVTQQGGRMQNPGKCSQIRYFSLEQQTRCSTPSRPHQKQISYSKRGGTTPQAKTVEHPEQPSHASQHCARAQEIACLPLLKTDWLLTRRLPGPARWREQRGGGWPHCGTAETHAVGCHTTRNNKK